MVITGNCCDPSVAPLDEQWQEVVLNGKVVSRGVPRAADIKTELHLTAGFTGERE